MAERKKDTNAFSALVFISEHFKGIHSDIGRINFGMSVIIAIVILAIVISPIAYYILYGFLLLCNTVLSGMGKRLLSLGMTAIPVWLIIVCVLLLAGESLLCAYLVTRSEQKMKEVGLTLPSEAEHDN